MAPQDLMVKLDRQVFKDQSGLQDLQEILVFQVIMDSLVPREQLVPQERQDNKDHKDQQDLMDCRALQGQQGQLDNPVLQGRASRDLQEHLEHLELTAHLVLKDLQVP